METPVVKGNFIRYDQLNIIDKVHYSGSSRVLLKISIESWTDIIDIRITVNPKNGREKERSHIVPSMQFCDIGVKGALYYNRNWKRLIVPCYNRHRPAVTIIS